MATTTPNYGWTVPTSTDLVKDGATAIETLGDAIDASMNTALGTKKAGMVLLNTTSFSGVSSQNITAFSSDYSNYKMVVKFSAFSTSLDVRLRLSASGVDDTSSNYNFGYRYVRSSGAGGDVQNNLLSYLLIGYGVSAQPEDCRFTADIVSPFLAERTSVMGSGTWNDATSWLSVTGAGAHRVSTSYNGISLLASTGTFSGIVSIYGYNK